MENNAHFLIIGGGLSGLITAVHLLDSGCKVTLVDRGNNKSSVVAAGQINPLVFRRMTKSWRVDEFLPAAQKLYALIEKNTQTTFYNEITIRRFFSTPTEKEMWLEKQNTPEFEAYMHTLTAEDASFSELKNDFGSARVKQTAFINTTIFMEATKAYIQSKGGEFIQENVDYARINPENVTYKNKAYSTIIFCEGADSVDNPWFGYLPIGATKGEILTVKNEKLSTKEAYNRKCFLLPIGNDNFKLGATYVWNTNNTIPTEEGKLDLLKNALFLTDDVLNVVEHKAGVRPTTMDRRPVLGRHHQFKNLAFFNGLGAKGYLLAPVIAKEFCQYLLNDVPVLKEMSISRYDKHLPINGK